MDPVLLLNASYEPLQIVSWQRAVTLVIGGKAEVLEGRERTLRSAGGFSMQLPAVVRLVKMVAAPRAGAVPLTKRALQARDRGVCQVAGCDERGSTVDHVIPRSRGGRHEWNNVALMCHDHNGAKDDKTLAELGWTLKADPARPSARIVMTTVVLNDPMMSQWAFT